MGMFDYISCEMPLLVAAHAVPPFKKGHLFQTKDLDNALIEYKIGKDRVLYQRKVQYERRELDEEEKKDRDSGAFWHPGWVMEEKSHEWVRER